MIAGGAVDDAIAPKISAREMFLENMYIPTSTNKYVVTAVKIAIMKGLLPSFFSSSIGNSVPIKKEINDNAMVVKISKFVNSSKLINFKQNGPITIPAIK